MTRPPAAAQELRFLRFVAEHGPLTVGQVAEQLGHQLGVARSTVLTVMERLRGKGHLKRRRRNGVYVYTSTVGLDRLLQDTVGQFVERSLGGSVLPFAAWLSQRVDVSEAELTELRAIVARLKTRKEEP